MPVNSNFYRAVVIFAMTSGSAAWAQHGQYYDYVYKVSVNDSNQLAINVKSGSSFNPANPDHCPNGAYAESKYPLSDDRTRAWLQVAMASLLSHKKVYMTTAGCRPDGYLALTGLQLEEQ